MHQSINLTSSLNSEFTLKQLAVTNTSSSLPPEAVHCHKPAKKCPHYGGSDQDQPDCPAQKALQWLKGQGITRGKPEDLFDKARESKRSEICAIVGKEQKPVMKLNSSLMNRRQKLLAK